MVPDMPPNAKIIGSPGYRARINAYVYEMSQEQLLEEHAHTCRRSNEEEREVAISYEIPIRQQAHAFRVLRELGGNSEGVISEDGNILHAVQVIRQVVVKPFVTFST